MKKKRSKGKSAAKRTKRSAGSKQRVVSQPVTSYITLRYILEPKKGNKPPKWRKWKETTYVHEIDLTEGKVKHGLSKAG